MYSTLRCNMLRALCALALLCLGFIPACATETVLHTMTDNYFPGSYPIGQLTPYNSLLYGVTAYGINGLGDVFTMTTSGAVKIIHEFGGGANDGAVPNAGLVQTGGNFYGTTIEGGSSNVGVVFKMTPTGTITILHTFTGYNSTTPSLSDGSNPYGGLLLGHDGKLYGTTDSGGVNKQGSVFSIATDGSGYTLLHSFLSTADTAYEPLAGLAQSASGTLYGTAYNANGFNGGIYKLNTDGSGFAFVHGFNNSDPLGYNPFSDLIAANDGNLYGLCQNGGVNDFGTVFKIVPGTTDALSVLWAFDGEAGAYPAPSNGFYAQNRLIQGTDHNLYGVTREGGTNGYGAAFKLTLAGVCTTLTNFSAADSYGTANPLVQSGSSFYLTSYNGGITAADDAANGYGAGMSISSSGSLKVIQSFYVRDAFRSYAGLVQVGTGSSAAFYGVTYGGGEFSDGAIIKITSTGAFSIIHHLNNSTFIWEGANPVGGLLLGRDGNLYGTTTAGGKYGVGTIFKVTTSGKLTVLHHFQVGGLEGYSPTNALVQGVGTDSNLYGASYQGGPSGGAGSVFSIATSGSSFKVLHYFGIGSPEGSLPSCTPVPDGAGNLYGTCYQGGAHNLGTIWKLSTNGATFTKLFDFYFDSTLDYSPAGENPNYNRMALINGTLYGIAPQGGQFSDGVIFQCNTSTGATTAFHAFNNGVGEGFTPVGGLSSTTATTASASSSSKPRHRKARMKAEG